MFKWINLLSIHPLIIIVMLFGNSQAQERSSVIDPTPISSFPRSPDQTTSKNTSIPTSNQTLRSVVTDVTLQREQIKPPKSSKPVMKKSEKKYSPRQTQYPRMNDSYLKPLSNSNVKKHFKLLKSKQIAYDPNELVLLSQSMSSAKEQAKKMTGYNLRLRSRKNLKYLNMVLTVFKKTDKEAIEVKLARIKADIKNIPLALNYFYYPLSRETERQSVFEQIHYKPRVIKPEKNNQCGKNKRIGMLDGPIVIQHPALKQQKILQKNHLKNSQQSASSQHATAIASILVGTSSIPEFAGVIPEAQLFNAQIMFKNKNDKATTNSALFISGLNWLLGQQVQVINISLGGQYNPLIEKVIQILIKKNLILIASAGNEGSNSSSVYPAAQKDVIAVIAVDLLNQRDQASNTGDYIDMAAPGVELWVANAKGKGGRYETGTSYASPWVAAALLIDNDINKLFTEAYDLGARGKDKEYGWGLLNFDCTSQL